MVKINKSKTVMVNGMPHGVKLHGVRKFFKPCGGIQYIDILKFQDSGKSRGMCTITFKRATGAQKAIAAIDLAIQTINTQRGTLGATQNRLEMTISNLGSMRENLQAADSRIRDVDVAEETAAMSRNQILSQAGTSVLAQANQLPQSALSLIG